MTVETIPITNREMWLKLREADVTASVAGCLLGVHDYQTPLGLWALKSGRIAEDPEETPPMRRGRLLEPVAIQLLREERPKWKITEPGVYLRDPDVRLGATPDAYAFDRERGPGIVQIKTVAPSQFRQKWQSGDDDAVEPPLWIAVQAIVEAHLAGAKWAAVAAMTVSWGVDLHVVDVPIHAGLIGRIEEKVREFWALVDSGEEPPADYGRDGDLLGYLYPEDKGTEVDLTFDNRVMELVDTRAELKREIKEASEAVDGIDNEIKTKIGDHAAALLPGGKRITWKTQTRKAYSVPEQSYRVLRYPRVQR